tara:strand:+ start:737 stop:865 length:129 start_codon:yes stop_codon:yes gene_type:complete
MWDFTSEKMTAVYVETQVETIYPKPYQRVFNMLCGTGVGVHF